MAHASAEDAAPVAVDSLVASADASLLLKFTTDSCSKKVMEAQLTDEELAWVAALRRAVQAEAADVVAYAASLSLFEMAQYAIVSKGDVEKGCSRLRTMSSVHTELKLDEVDGAEALAYMLEKWPSMFLVAAVDATGMPIWGMRYRDFAPKDVKSRPLWKMYMKTQLAFLDSMMCDLRAVRLGLEIVCDMAGMGWSNFDREVEERGTSVFQDGYPMKIHGFVLSDSPWWINALLAIARLFVKKKLMEKITMVKSADGAIAPRLPAGATPRSMGGGDAAPTDEESIAASVRWMEARLARRAACIAAVEAQGAGVGAGGSCVAPGEAPAGAPGAAAAADAGNSGGSI